MINEKRDIEIIRNVLVCAEQGRQDIKYDAVYIYADGPNNVKQITYSIGFTQFGGNLEKVLRDYKEKGGRYGLELGGYIQEMKKLDLYSNATFKRLLTEAGKMDPVMGSVQEFMFKECYLKPGVKWGEGELFELPLSYLVICDSYLHSGSILGFLRERFPEKTPKNGGSEKVWIRQYVDVRHKWLASHSNQLLRNTVYRTNYLKELIKLDDWELNVYSNIAMNGVKPKAYGEEEGRLV